VITSLSGSPSICLYGKGTGDESQDSALFGQPDQLMCPSCLKKDVWLTEKLKGERGKNRSLLHVHRLRGQERDGGGVVALKGDSNIFQSRIGHLSTDCETAEEALKSIARVKMWVFRTYHLPDRSRAGLSILKKIAMEDHREARSKFLGGVGVGGAA